MRLITGLLLGAFCQAAIASVYDPIIDRQARNHGVDPYVLRAIAQQESNKKPWTFNADGEGFHFESKAKAVNALWSLTKAPWLVKISPPEGGRVIRRFFPSRASATAFLNSYQRGRKVMSKSMLAVRQDTGKEVRRGEARIRRIWLLNTDIGIAQINYRYHGQGKASIQKWFDPSFNLGYAASHIANLKRQYHVGDVEAAGYYHSKTPSVRNKYLSSFKRKYEKERNSALGDRVAAN